MIKLTNDQFARAIHELLYQRLAAFCEEHTPEIPASSVVETWLTRLYNNDPSLHILVDWDTSKGIVGHAVIDVQSIYGHNVLFCHQVQGEKNSVVALNEGMEYIEKLAIAANVECIALQAVKSTKALQQKYGFHITRTVMVKHIGDNNGH